MNARTPSKRTQSGLRHGSLCLLASTLISCTTDTETQSAMRSITSDLDWTPLFNSWTQGCSSNPTLDDFVGGLEENKVVLPQPYLSGTGMLSRNQTRDEVSIRVPMTGMYHGLPVKAFERYRGTENGVQGYELTLAVKPTVAKKALAHVAYQPDAEREFRAVIFAAVDEAALVCDRSM